MSEDTGKIDLHLVPVENPEELNLILGQSHFIKTVEDLHEALAGAVPGLQFGIAFCESSGPRLVRRSGNDDELVELAVRNALSIGAGHSFIVFLRQGFPVNVLGQIKSVSEVCQIYCATANPRAGNRRRDRRRTRDPRRGGRGFAARRGERSRRRSAQATAPRTRLQAMRAPE